MSRRTKTVAGIVGALVGIPAIAAAAAILISTTISGTASFASTTAAQSVSAVSGTNDGIDCASAAQAGTGITVNPKVKKINGVTQAGSCLITGTLRNDSPTETLAVKGVEIVPPAGGFTVAITNVAIGDTIAPGASKVITVRLSAPANVQVGPFVAKLHTEVVGSAA